MLRPSHHASILEALRATARRAPASIARWRRRKATSYDALVDQLEGSCATCAPVGSRLTDRVAVALPNGPEAAAAVLGTVAAAACAPLAPDLPEAEFVNQLTTLGVRAVMVLRGHETAHARRVVVRDSVIEVDTGDPPGRSPAPACYLVTGRPAARAPTPTRRCCCSPRARRRARSSCRSRTQPAASARQRRGDAPLTPADRCLNVMPLFHIHGLVAALLGVARRRRQRRLHAGVPTRRSSEMDRGVPTDLVHRGPDDAPGDVRRARVAHRRGRRSRRPFRFVRSSSAALPPGHGRSSRRLRRPGDRGLRNDRGRAPDDEQSAAAARPQARERWARPPVPTSRCIDDDGQVLRCGRAGEVVIRGANVTSGYVDNPDANAGAFVDGWFRTGDQGRFDEDGYLTITGRLKEIINRGGEKVAPREIDDALLEHADVVEAAAFAIPHDRLGEDVAAAVVLRDGADVTTAATPHLRRGTAGALQGSPPGGRRRSDPPGPNGQDRAYEPGRDPRAGRAALQAGARPASTSTRPMTSNGSSVRSGSASWISTNRRAPIASSSSSATR